MQDASTLARTLNRDSKIEEVGKEEGNEGTKKNIDHELYQEIRTKMAISQKWRGKVIVAERQQQDQELKKITLFNSFFKKP